MNSDHRGIKTIGEGDYDMLGLIINHLHQEFHGSLDLNYPHPILKSTQSHFDLSSQPLQSKPIFYGEIEVRRPQKEDKKKCHMEMETDKEVNKMSHDLNLRLSPPGMNPKDLSSNQLEISQSPSIESCDNMVPLILMGCTKCLIYVMVCEVDPKCPNCKTSFFIDIFNHTLPKTKRSRRCYFVSILNSKPIMECSSVLQ
ncbi:hypothetical protein P3X46_014000 [Hevea brasiliensis]|uniref:GIR1-like zinc ribbon domain-containing protein n=1 Tax=Hevea brasiliensis TaxID=3981 RepID=A0ABQ9M958_HEVBR|nr:hypothetical protein P3X46_014000 [Hevea brasiliensis]